MPSARRLTKLMNTTTRFVTLRLQGRNKQASGSNLPRLMQASAQRFISTEKCSSFVSPLVRLLEVASHVHSALERVVAIGLNVTEGEHPTHPMADPCRDLRVTGFLWEGC